jgi:hypothetical protein
MCRETKLEGKNNNWYDQGVEMTFQALILATVDFKHHNNQRSEVHLVSPGRGGVHAPPGQVTA